MKPIEFSDEALNEAENASAYLEDRQAGLGEEFERDLADALSRLQANPESYPVERGKVRRCMFKKFS